MTATLQAADLDQFIGSETVYRHALNRSAAYTEGVKYLADKAGAYWLLDEVALAQLQPAVAKEPFQSWTLAVQSDRRALLVADDGNGNVLLAKAIAFTDFPLASIKLFFIDGVILLPSEY